MCFSVTRLKITRFCSKYLSHLLSFLTLRMLEIASHYQKIFRLGMPPDPPSIRGSLHDPQTTNLLVRNYRLLHQCVGISVCVLSPPPSPRRKTVTGSAGNSGGGLLLYNIKFILIYLTMHSHQAVYRNDGVNVDVCRVRPASWPRYSCAVFASWAR